MDHFGYDLRDFELSINTSKHFELDSTICFKSILIYDCDVSIINSFNTSLINLLIHSKDITRKHLITNAMVILATSIKHRKCFSMTLLRFIIDKFVRSSQNIHHIRKLNNMKLTKALTEKNHIEKCDAYYNTIDILLRNGSNPAAQQFIEKVKSENNYKTSFSINSGISSMEVGLTQRYAGHSDQSWRKYMHILSFALQPKSKNYSFTPPILSIKYLFHPNDGYAVNTNIEMSFFSGAFKNPFGSKKNGLLSPKRVIELLWKGYNLIHAQTDYHIEVQTQTLIDHFCGGSFEYIKGSSSHSVHGHDNPKSKVLLILFILKTCFQIFCNQLLSTLYMYITNNGYDPLPTDVTYIIFNYLTEDKNIFSGLGMNYLCSKAFEYFPSLPCDWQLWVIDNILSQTDPKYIENIKKATKEYYYWPHYISYIHFYIDRCDALIEYLLNMYQGPWNAVSCFTSVLWKYRNNIKIVKLLMEKSLIQPMCKANLIYDIIMDDMVNEHITAVIMDNFYRQNNGNKNSLNLKQTMTRVFGKLCENIKTQNDISEMLILKLKMMLRQKYSNNWIDISSLLMKLCKNHLLLEFMMRFKLLNVSQCLLNTQRLKSSLIKFDDSNANILKRYLRYLGGDLSDEMQKKQLKDVCGTCVQPALFRENEICAEMFTNFEL